jgi:hypothetical protein
VYLCQSYAALAALGAVVLDGEPWEARRVVLDGAALATLGAVVLDGAALAALSRRSARSGPGELLHPFRSGLLQ